MFRLAVRGPTGFYEQDSGVLWNVFTEPVKLALIQNGTGPGLPGAETATDRAAMIAFPPVSLAAGSEVVVRFWLLAAQDETAAAARLLALRAEPIDPPHGGGDRFVVDPPYPNPLKVGEGIMKFPVEIPSGSIGTGSSLELEVFDWRVGDCTGRAGTSRPPGPHRVLTWDGLLDDGRPAAAGVYMYVVTFDGVTRTGRLMLVR